MSKSKKVALLVLIFSAGYLIYINTRETKEAPAFIQKDKVAIKKEVTQPSSFKIPAPVFKGKQAPLPQFKKPKNRAESLGLIKDLVKTIGVREEQHPTQFIQSLKKLDLSPLSSKDSNPYTGSIIKIRTQKTMPGVRYFSAQYMGEDNEFFLSSVSFEVRSSLSEFEAFSSSLAKTYGLGKLLESKKGFKLWKFGADHVISAKVLEAEDIENHPENVYNASDIGNTTEVMIDSVLNSHDEE